MKLPEKYICNCTNCEHYTHEKKTRGYVSCNIFKCLLDDEDLADKPPSEHHCNLYEMKGEPQ